MEGRIYILKSDVLDLITEEYKAGGFTYYSDYSNLWDAVDDIPSADVQPVERGEWRFSEDGYCRCSLCGQKAPYFGDDEPAATDYCPYCGAKMDGGDSNA